MLAISCAEMKAIDSYAIKKMGIPSIVLMENAALKVIEQIDLAKQQSFTVICAPGNNGGDGLAIARHLLVRDKKVDLFIIGDLAHATTDFQINLKILKNMQVPYTPIVDTNSLVKFKKALQHSDATIDAIFGIGLDRPIEGLFYQAIAQMNQYAKSIIAVDTPSGLDGDSGEVQGIAVEAEQTICFHLIKTGLLNNSRYTGAIHVVNIGIPKIVTKIILNDNSF